MSSELKERLARLPNVQNSEAVSNLVRTWQVDERCGGKLKPVRYRFNACLMSQHTGAIEENVTWSIVQSLDSCL